jgi:hypothetical protein
MNKLSNFIAAANTLSFLQSILRMPHEHSVKFINEVAPDELANALQTHGANPYFVFSLTNACIQQNQPTTSSFPQKLAELVYDAVIRQADGTQEFLAVLNQADKNKVSRCSRCLLGLCESASPEDLKSFLKAKNSSPLILFYWLLLAVRGEKQIVKELFQILARIAKQNMKPNAKLDYSDVIQALLNHQEFFLFHENKGVFAVILEKGFVGNILNLFEVQWNFTFAQISFVQKFLQKRPIDASLLIEPSYMSANCSRFLIGTVMNLAALLDPLGRLTKPTLLLPANFTGISEFVYLSDPQHLENLFRPNHESFDTHVIPGKYTVSFVIKFFMNLHLRRNPELFSRMLGALKTYGSKLSREDLNAMKTTLAHFHEDRKEEAAIFAAFMCIDRPESLPCLKDHIAVLKTIFMVIGKCVDTLIVRDCDPTKLKGIVSSLRKILPDFILNARMLFVNGISFLPVVNLHATSQPVIAFLQANALAGSFPCMLQLLMTSDHLDLLKVHMIAVMSFIGTQVDQVGPNDVTYRLNLAEMLKILHACFTKLDTKMLDFNNHICALFTNPIVLDAFVADPRFAEQTRGLRNDREIARMRQECQAHCAQHGTTMAEAQRALGHVVFGGCPICTELSTPPFTTILQCGHCFCTGCAEQVRPNCPTCRARITHRTQADSLGIRFRPDPAPQASGQPAQKMQRQEE